MTLDANFYTLDQANSAKDHQVPVRMMKPFSSFIYALYHPFNPSSFSLYNAGKAVLLAKKSCLALLFAVIWRPKIPQKIQ